MKHGLWKLTMALVGLFLPHLASANCEIGDPLNAKIKVRYSNDGGTTWSGWQDGPLSVYAGTKLGFRAVKADGVTTASTIDRDRYNGLDMDDTAVYEWDYATENGIDSPPNYTGVSFEKTFNNPGDRTVRLAVRDLVNCYDDPNKTNTLVVKVLLAVEKDVMASSQLPNTSALISGLAAAGMTVVERGGNDTYSVANSPQYFGAEANKLGIFTTYRNVATQLYVVGGRFRTLANDCSSPTGGCTFGTTYGYASGEDYSIIYISAMNNFISSGQGSGTVSDYNQCVSVPDSF
jgi:hypothetical protein